MQQNFKWTKEQLQEIYKTEYKGYSLKNEDNNFSKQWKTKVCRELIVDKYSTEKCLAIQNPINGSLILFPKKFIYDEKPEKKYILLSAYSNMMYWRYEHGERSDLTIKTQISGWQLGDDFKAFNFCTILILGLKKMKQFILKKKQSIVDWFNEKLFGLISDLRVFKLNKNDERSWLNIYFEYKRKLVLNKEDLKWFAQQAKEQIDIEQKSEKYNNFKRNKKRLTREANYDKYEIEYI